MTDEELIEALRSIDHMNVDDCFLQSHLHSKAADRIEQLVNEGNETHEEAMSWIEKWGDALKGQREAEAKLAKAVEALKNIAHGGGYTDMQIARAALLTQLEKAE
jgi:hypothetical protein